VLALLTRSQLSDLERQAAQERRNEALIKFIQAGATVAIGFWLAPLFYGQANLVLAAAVACSVPFIIEGFKVWLSDTPVSPRIPAKKPTTAVRQNPRVQKYPSLPRRNPRTQKLPNPAAKSPQRQDAIAEILSELQQQGWRIAYNLMVPDLGNVDVFLQSPNNNYFIIHVESYQGEVFFDESILKRRDRNSIYHFERDLLQIVMEQALAIKVMKKLQLVVPILCFTEAVLSIETINNKARDVYVVKKESLVKKLLRLDNG